jgi:hypothetical protein
MLIYRIDLVRSRDDRDILKCYGFLLLPIIPYGT